MPDPIDKQVAEMQAEIEALKKLLKQEPAPINPAAEPEAVRKTVKEMEDAAAKLTKALPQGTKVNRYKEKMDDKVLEEKDC
jgi:hypothetical protein